MVIDSFGWGNWPKLGQSRDFLTLTSSVAIVDPISDDVSKGGVPPLIS